MFHEQVPAELAARCAQVLEAPWPGIKILQFGASSVGGDGSGANLTGSA